MPGCVDSLNRLSIRLFLFPRILWGNHIFWSVIFELVLETLVILMWIEERGTVNNRLASNNIHSFFAIMLMNKVFVWCGGNTLSGTKTYSFIRLMSCHKAVIGCESDLQRSEIPYIFFAASPSVFYHWCPESYETSSIKIIYYFKYFFRNECNQ